MSWQSLYPFTGAFHPTPDGHRMHVLDEGEGGPTLILLHGNPTWSFYYRRLIVALRGRCRLVAPDHLGMGRSDKPAWGGYQLADHVDRLEHLLAARVPEGPVTLVMHDWGGAIGMGWAVRHPDRVARLVVLNTAAFRSPFCPLRIRVCRWPVVGPLAVRGLGAFERAAIRMAVERPMTADVRAGFLAPYRNWASRVAVQRFVQDIPLWSGHPTYVTLQTIEDGLAQLRDRPMQVHWGLKDWCFTTHFLDRWLERFPDADVHRYPDAGHYVLEDAAARIIPQIAGFVD